MKMLQRGLLPLLGLGCVFLCASAFAMVGRKARSLPDVKALDEAWRASEQEGKPEVKYYPGAGTFDVRHGSVSPLDPRQEVYFELEEGSQCLPWVIVYNNDIQRLLTRFESFDGRNLVKLPHANMKISIGGKHDTQSRYLISSKDINGLRTIILSQDGPISLRYFNADEDKDISSEEEKGKARAALEKEFDEARVEQYKDVIKKVKQNDAAIAASHILPEMERHKVLLKLEQGLQGVVWVKICNASEDKDKGYKIERLFRQDLKDLSQGKPVSLLHQDELLVSLLHDDIDLSVGDASNNWLKFHIQREDVKDLKAIVLSLGNKILLQYDRPDRNKEVHVDYNSMKYDYINHTRGSCGKCNATCE